MQVPEEAQAVEKPLPPPRTEEQKKLTRKRVFHFVLFVLMVLGVVYLGINIGWAGILFIGYLFAR